MPIANPPVVSVVISTYNTSALLRECLKALRFQSALAKLEIIVVDSGSEQAEQEVCRQEAGHFPRLTYERTERESLYAAWNRGLAKARGKYFVNVNTDDALAPDALEFFVRAMDNNLGVALAYADCVW